MNAFAQLALDKPVVFLHLVTATAALVLGLVLMSRPKGTRPHRSIGWVWVGLMAVTTLASAFIRDHALPNIGGITPIHLFTVLVAFNLPYALWAIRRGHVQAHRSAMKGMFLGGCVLAGLFTLLPGRFLGNLLWHQVQGLAT
jgi:uncharacterized membrane protein